MIGVLEPLEIGRVTRMHSLRSMFGRDGPPTAALAALAAHVMPVRIRAGTVLAKDGEPVNTIYLVLEGELSAWRGGKHIGNFGPRTSVGLLPVLARDPLGYRCVALRDSSALAMRAEDALEMFEDHFDMMLGVLRGIARDAIAARRSLRPDAGFSNDAESCGDCPPRPLDLVERLLYMRNTFGLQEAHFDALAELAQAATEVRYPAGRLLWTAGARADHMLIVVSGSLRGRTDDGMSFAFGPGDIVGSLDMVAAVPRWFELTVDREVVALSFGSELLTDIWEDQPELSFDFLRSMARMLLALRERVSDQNDGVVQAAAAGVPPAP
jgi:CRP-like cAMP-binding protein